MLRYIIITTMSSSSALSEESEKDVLPWLKLAEDLRRLKLDVEVGITIDHEYYAEIMIKLNVLKS